MGPLVVFALIIGLSRPILAIDNGIGRTPAMGWNSWNHFSCNLTEQLIRNTIDALVSSGLRDAGYKYINLDDCWQGMRDANGTITADPNKFPSGMKNLSDYAHQNGLLFGIYSDAANLTCQGFSGSRGYETSDAQTYYEWGVDYLKYDNCYAVATDNVITRYTDMANALANSAPPNRTIYFSTCDWGVQDPWNWAPGIANSWRTSDDIQDNWNALTRCIDDTTYLAKYAGPGHWNDPDMLEVGNGGMQPHEYESHFALWCLLKAPLIIGCDVTPEGVTNTTGLTNTTKQLLMNMELIAVNQDPLGIAGDLVWKEGPNEVWAGPLINGTRIVVLFNRHTPSYPITPVDNGTQAITIPFNLIGYRSDTPAVIRDLILHENVTTVVGAYTGYVAIHGCLALKVTPLDYSAHPEYDSWRPWSNDTSDTSDDCSDSGTPWYVWFLIGAMLVLGIIIGYATRYVTKRNERSVLVNDYEAPNKRLID